MKREMLQTPRPHWPPPTFALVPPLSPASPSFSPSITTPPPPFSTTPAPYQLTLPPGAPSDTARLLDLMNASAMAIPDPAYRQCWICFSPTPPLFFMKVLQFTVHPSSARIPIIFPGVSTMIMPSLSARSLALAFAYIPTAPACLAKCCPPVIILCSSIPRPLLALINHVSLLHLMEPLCLCQWPHPAYYY